MDASEEFATLFALLTGSRGDPGQPVEAARAGMAEIMAGFPPPDDATFTRTRLGGRPAVEARMPGTREDRVVLYLHGGGYVLGDPGDDGDMLARLAAGAHARAIGLEYRLAPEHPYPAALSDALAAYRELIAGGISPEHVALVGISAGGGLAIAVAAALREDGDEVPAAVVGLSPWTDLSLESPSLELNAGKDWMSADELRAHAGQYLSGRDARAASPVHADLSGLPALLVQAAGDEVLIDDARRVARAAWRAGVPVTLSVWPHLCHGWQAFASRLPEGRTALDQVGAFLRGHLAGGRPGALPPGRIAGADA